jgi:hypothetical protein
VKLPAYRGSLRVVLPLTNRTELPRHREET